MKFGGVYWLLVTLYGLYESEKMGSMDSQNTFIIYLKS